MWCIVLQNGNAIYLVGPYDSEERADHDAQAASIMHQVTAHIAPLNPPEEEAFHTRLS